MYLEPQRKSKIQSKTSLYEIAIIKHEYNVRKRCENRSILNVKVIGYL